MHTGAPARAHTARLTGAEARTRTADMTVITRMDSVTAPPLARFMAAATRSEEVRACPQEPISAAAALGYLE